jgi:predicted GH43/DUF377 family glycosyl hydrolase
MSKVWCQVGKAGDIISLSPILYDEFKRTGIKPTLVVSKQYAPILERMNYIEPHIWSGDWQDLIGAVRHAKQNFDSVIVPQVFGKDFPIAHRTPSFQLDQWLRAGKIEKWDTLPTVIKRPANAKRIVKQYVNGKPTILYADHSQSSPFLHKDSLYRLLVDHFGKTHEIKRLSEIRLPHPLDLLALFDAADCLVTVETMALHLSAASEVPTIALIGDAPTRWKGSAWSKRFKLHVRYADYERRRPEIVSAVRKALRRQASPMLQTVKTHYLFGYNPSIIRHGENTIIVYRYHQDNHWPTQLAIMVNGVSAPIQSSFSADFSLEDGRLFILNGKLHCSYVAATSYNGKFRCVVGYAPLTLEDGSWRLGKHIQPKRAGNDFSQLEKNWVPFVKNEKLFFLYRSDPQMIFHMEEDRIVKEHSSGSVTWDWGEIRGDAIVPWKGKLLRIFHSRLGKSFEHGQFRYYIGAALMNSEPPFETIAVSKEPILAGNEKWTQCSRWKPNVCFCCGAMAVEDGIILSVGLNDCECATVFLGEHDLNL